VVRHFQTKKNVVWLNIQPNIVQLAPNCVSFSGRPPWQISQPEANWRQYGSSCHTRFHFWAIFQWENNTFVASVLYTDRIL